MIYLILAAILQQIRRLSNSVESMSLSAASIDFWEKTEGFAIGKKCEILLENELLSDVKFVVRDPDRGGEQFKTILAHKFVLAIKSPVFGAMFYGKAAEKNDAITISECDYLSLLELFRFIYCDQVNLNADNVLQVLYLANKYMLPSLVEKCTDFLIERVDASNVFEILSVAYIYKEKNLADKCWEVIDGHGDDALENEAFAKIEKSLLEELVERESLDVSEVKLFKAVDFWARRNCEEQKIKVNGTSKRKILGERIIKAIRFPVMEQKEFADVVLDSEILNRRETYNLMKYFNDVLRTPVGFRETKRSGRKPEIGIYT